MKIKCEIVYEDKGRNTEITVEVKGSPTGLRLMNAVERAVEKHMKEVSKETPTANDWKQWNLLGIVKEEA